MYMARRDDITNRTIYRSDIVTCCMMELSKQTIKGLFNIQSIETLPEETFQQLLEVVISHLLQCTGSKIESLAKLYGSRSDVVKKAFADITCLFIEAARYDYNEENLDSFLKSEHINGQRATVLVDIYTKHKKDVQTQLEFTGNGFPHIIDIDWRLDYCVKSNMHTLIDKPVYHVRMSTKKHGKLAAVTFTCSVQQLQDLVYKLKEVVRHVEKIANI